MKQVRRFIALFVLGVNGCAFRPVVVTNPSGATIQQQCGWMEGRDVSVPQAECIAFLAGLEIGVRPWVVTETGGPDQPAWMVWTEANRAYRGGRGLIIDRATGRILGAAERVHVASAVD